MNRIDLPADVLRSPWLFSWLAHAPDAWAGHAMWLYRGARQLRTHWELEPEAIRNDHRLGGQIRGPEFLLLGLAFEAAFKAIGNGIRDTWLKRLMTYVGPIGHDLLRLSKKAGLRASLAPDEVKLLKGLSAYIDYKATYPTPLSTKGWTMDPLWEPSWDATADALWERIRSAMSAEIQRVFDHGK